MNTEENNQEQKYLDIYPISKWKRILTFLVDFFILTFFIVYLIYLYLYYRPDIWPHLQYLPDEIKDELFFIPDKQGKYEIALSENYKKLLKQGRSSDMRSLKKKRWDI